MKQFTLKVTIMSYSSATTDADENRSSTPVMIRLNDDLQDLGIAPVARTSRRSKGSYIVVSGGTAANDFVQAFGKDCAFVLPGELFSAQLRTMPHLIRSFPS